MLDGRCTPDRVQVLCRSISVRKTVEVKILNQIFLLIFFLIMEKPRPRILELTHFTEPGSCKLVIGCGADDFGIELGTEFGGVMPLDGALLCWRLSVCV